MAPEPPLSLAPRVRRGATTTRSDRNDYFRVHGQASHSGHRAAQAASAA